MVALGLQQQRVHVRMARYASSLGLYGLRTAYLQPFRCGIRVEGHVLSLKGSRLVAVLLEDATEGCGDDALADIAASTGEHDAIEFM